MSAVWLWVLIMLPGALGAGLCLTGRRSDRVAGPVGVTVAAIVTMVAVGVALGRPAVSVPFVAGADFGLAVDPLAAVVLPTVAVVALLVLGFAAAERGGDVPRAPSRFFGLMLLFLAAVLITATAATLPALVLGWEVMGATSYALIGFRWQDDSRVAGGTTALLTTRAADLGLYLAAGAALAAGSALDLAGLPALPAPWRDVAAAGVLIAALGKAAQLPFSFWLSRAMLGPSPVSALLHSAAMVAMGGYLLLRLAPLLAATGWAATVAAWAGGLTALILGAVAVAQQDLKQLLAASTAAQLGFVVLAAGVSAPAGGTAHLVAHAATKAVLFLVAGAWLTALGTKQLPALRGVGRRWPLVGVCASIGLLALAGAPPLSLWATKDLILAAVREVSPALALVTLVAAALSAAYAGKVLVLLWLRPPAEGNGLAAELFDTEEPGTRRVPRAAQVVMIPLAAGAAVLGVLALPPLAPRLASALGAPGEPESTPLELIGSGVLALLVLAAVARWGTVAPGWAAGWLHLDRLAGRLVVQPVLRVAAALARFDDTVLDRGVTGVGAVVVGGARRLARFDDRAIDRMVRDAASGTARVADRADHVDAAGIDAAVLGLAAAVRRSARLARRPQTGQLYQYYVQVIAALLLAALLLILVI